VTAEKSKRGCSRGEQRRVNRRAAGTSARHIFILPSPLMVCRFWGVNSQSLNVAYVASLARIDLSKEEEALFQSQLGKVLEYARELQQVDVSSVPDTPVDPNLPTNVLREDVVRPSLSAAAALRNAPQQANHLFIMPKIIE
jgi:aspartyl-tRNA(Asn)/glutamyl-tRNA(Gln) amidotransferase subunit C